MSVKELEQQYEIFQIKNTEILTTRAVQLIAYDYHAHLVSKAGYMIGGKSQSPVFKRSGS